MNTSGGTISVEFRMKNFLGAYACFLSVASTLSCAFALLLGTDGCLCLTIRTLSLPFGELREGFHRNNNHFHSRNATYVKALKEWL